MPRRGQRLDRPGRDAVDADALGAEAGREVAHAGLERRLGQAHRVVVGNAAQRPQIGQGEERRARRAAAAPPPWPWPGSCSSRCRGRSGTPRATGLRGSRRRSLPAARSRSSGRSRRRSARPRPARRTSPSIWASSATSQSKTRVRAELGGEFGDPLLEALALVAEGELRAFAAAGPGDAVGDRAVRQDAGDEEALAGEKSHASGASRREGGADDSGMQTRAPAGLDSRVTCRYLGERIQFRSSLESVKWADSSGPFFWLIALCPSLCTSIRRRTVAAA